MGGVRGKCVVWWDECHGQTAKDIIKNKDIIKVPFVPASYPGHCYGKLSAEVAGYRDTLVKSSRADLP